jgi:hypothetical protein
LAKLPKKLPWVEPLNASAWPRAPNCRVAPVWLMMPDASAPSTAPAARERSLRLAHGYGRLPAERDHLEPEDGVRVEGKSREEDDGAVKKLNVSIMLCIKL